MEITFYIQFRICRTYLTGRIVPICINKIPPVRPGGGTWLVIIADNIEMSGLPAVCGIAAPVVDDIVAVIYIAPVGIDIASVYLRMIYTGIAAVVVGEQIVMERGVLSAPDAAVAVRAFSVQGLIQCL